MTTPKAWLLLAVLCLIANVVVADSATGRLRIARPDERKSRLAKRQGSSGDGGQQQQAASMSDTDPVGAINLVKTFPNLNQNEPTWAQEQYGQIIQSADGDEAQVPWFDGGNFPFTQTTNVPMGANNLGWSWIPPNFQGFVMNTSLQITNQTFTMENGTTTMGVVQPYFISDDVDYTQVKRVIVALPGKPRDSWKYANLFYNARNWVYNQSLYGIQPGEVMIIAPTVLNLDDQAAGGVEPNWAAYNSSIWQMGGVTHYPNLTHSVSFYSAMDKILDLAMDRTLFPKVNQLVVAGHSMGGQAVARYALLKREKKYDASVKYWIGNPGSWPWLQNDTQPVTNAPLQCDPVELKNRWPYGLGYNLSVVPKYARSEVMQDTQPFVQRFFQKQIHYGLALLDNGAGDTHCQAQYQGANHLERGTNFVSALATMNNNAWPVNHSLGYVAGVSHQDYPMIAATSSLDFIFGKDFNATRNDTFGLPHTPKSKGTPNKQEDPEDNHKVHIYQAAAWVVLAAIIVALIAAYFAIDRIFTPNTNDWDRDYWESDFKRRLL